MKCTLSPEAGVICFLTEALTGWKRLVYLKRHHADLTRDSCFFLRTHSLGTMLSATRLFCRTVFGCWRRLFADIITARESAELIPLQFSAARRHAASRWRALLSTHTVICQVDGSNLWIHLLNCDFNVLVLYSSTLQRQISYFLLH